MGHSAERFLMGLVAVLLFFPMGCQQSDTDSTKDTPTTDSATPRSVEIVKHDTPEAVFTAAKKSMQSKDYTMLGHCLSPKTQEIAAAVLVKGSTKLKKFVSMGGIFSQGNGTNGGSDDFDAKQAMIDNTLKKHGISQRALQSISEMGNQTKDLAKITRPIKDKVAFIADMLQVVEKLLGENQILPEMLEATLTDVQVSTDTATGTITHHQTGREISQPIEFVKIDGSWLLELPEEVIRGKNPLGSLMGNGTKGGLPSLINHFN